MTTSIKYPSINNQFSWLASQKGHSNGLVDEGSGFPRMLASSETFAKNTKPAKNPSCLRGFVANFDFFSVALFTRVICETCG